MANDRSGALRKRIELWRKTVSKNEFGEYSEEWNLYKYVRAYNHRHYGDQGLDNNEIFDSIHIRIVVRNQTDMTEMDRLFVDGHMYTIDFIQPDDTGRWNQIRCSKINE